MNEQDRRTRRHDSSSNEIGNRLVFFFKNPVCQIADVCSNCLRGCLKPDYFLSHGQFRLGGVLVLLENGGGRDALTLCQFRHWSILESTVVRHLHSLTS